MPRVVFLAALVIATASVRPSGQTFTASTALVTIPLTVTDRATGGAVGGLGAADFRVVEAGIEQPVSAVTAERQAVSVCIVMDRSTSVVGARKEAAEALVNELFNALPLDDEVSLVTFALEPSLELDWVRAGARPRVVWKQVPSGGGSAIADAMALAVRHLERASKPRRVVLAISDGREQGSATTIRKLATSRRQSETQLYAFGLSVIVPRYPANMRYLQGVVGDSGGYVHIVRQIADAPIAVHDLLAEFANQYLLGFAPTRPFDGTYRRVTVEAKNPAFEVRHRAGYLALP